MADAIEVIELTHKYNSLAAVDAISFNIASGSIFGLLGPNGAGKSTTIKMLTTLLPVTGGSAKVMGYDLVHEAASIRKQIGYVPQLISADGEMTGYENLVLFAKLYGLTKDYRERRIEEVLQFMSLAEFKSKLVKTYSGGMIRRLEIAQSLIHAPSILFLDEPTVGLDPGSRRLLWEIILEWRQRFSITILLTTHDMEEADFLCDRVGFMQSGKIVVIGPPEELKKSIGSTTLDEVFIHYTGGSLKEGGTFAHAKERRRTISKL